MRRAGRLSAPHTAIVDEISAPYNACSGKNPETSSLFYAFFQLKAHKYEMARYAAFSGIFRGLNLNSCSIFARLTPQKPHATMSMTSKGCRLLTDYGGVYHRGTDAVIPLADRLGSINVLDAAFFVYKSSERSD